MDQGENRVALDGRLAELRQRHSSFPDRDQPFASLAEAIVWCAKVPAETTVLEATAGARRPMADVADAEERVRSVELERARACALDFENGLRLARAAPGLELTLESVDPAQDRLAGALISILVASDLATVRTDDLGGEEYRYHVAIDWAALDGMAVRIGLPPVTRLLDDRPV
ncbi:MAG: hypothetical protein U0893_12630 [Chloroflexota bacterium]